MLTGGLEQSDWSPCTKTQLSHQCQWEVLDKLLDHPVYAFLGPVLSSEVKIDIILVIHLYSVI